MGNPKTFYVKFMLKFGWDLFEIPVIIHLLLPKHFIKYSTFPLGCVLQL